MEFAKKTEEKDAPFFKFIWHFMKAYPGFLLYIFTVASIFLVPFFWANGNEQAFKGTLWFVMALFAGLYAWILYRLSTFSKYSSSLSRLLVLLIEITLGFSAIYMWMIFFDPVGQFEGFKNYQVVFKNPVKIYYLNNSYLIDVIKLAIDCNHFSIVSATTVGYGDMYPKTQFARFLVDFQLGYTFTIVAIGIGKYSDRNVDSAKLNMQVVPKRRKPASKYRPLRRHNKGD